jgi:carbonic anhydrase
MTDSQTVGVTPDQAAERLLEGNRRYVVQQAKHPNQMDEHRRALLAGQFPIVALLSCTDSRVPPELIFDQGVGDLFVVRLAGNILSDHALASVEFAVLVLRVPLVMVMGHSYCGAVEETLSGQPLPGHMSHLAAAIQPAAVKAAALPGDRVINTARLHAQMTGEQFTQRSSIVAEAVDKGRLKIMAAFYHLETGEVEILTQ